MKYNERLLLSAVSMVFGSELQDLFLSVYILLRLLIFCRSRVPFQPIYLCKNKIKKTIFYMDGLHIGVDDSTKLFFFFYVVKTVFSVLQKAIYTGKAAHGQRSENITLQTTSYFNKKKSSSVLQILVLITDVPYLAVVNK